MRWITPTLLVASLVFSTGGVAIVGHADSPAETKAAVTKPAKDAATQCAVPTQKPRNSAATRRKRVASLGAGQNTIVLNTSGYNYAADGEWKGSPVEPPHGVPDGVIPKSTKQVVPAPAAPAPASK